MAVIASPVRDAGGYEGWDARSTVSADFLLPRDAPAVSSSIRRQGQAGHSTQTRTGRASGYDDQRGSSQTSLLQALSAVRLSEDDDLRQNRPRVRDSLSSASLTNLSSVSMSDSRRANIDRENSRLCRRIQEELTRPPTKSFSWRPSSATSQERRATSGVNRQRRDDRIFRENQALLHRINSAKPSKDLAVSEHKKHFAKHLQYSQNASRRKPLCPSPTLRSSAPTMQWQEKGFGRPSHYTTQPVWEAGW